MRLKLEVEGGPRLTFEGVSRTAILEVIWGLVQAPGFISSTYKEMDVDETPKGDLSRPPNGRPPKVPGESPRTQRGASKRALAITGEILADAEWHSKAELVTAWQREGLKERTADRAVARLAGLKRARRSGRAWWKLEPPVPMPDGVGESTGHGAFAFNGSGDD